jgi:hypothetical protein
MSGRAARVLAAAIVLFGAASCGGGDDDDEASDGATKPGTCDLRELQGTCIETLNAPTRFLLDQQQACLDNMATWSREVCPETTELIGCCEYTFGNAFRECFYQGTSRSDPEAYCLSTDLWSDGVWTPAGS